MVFIKEDGSALLGHGNVRLEFGRSPVENLGLDPVWRVADRYV